MSNNFKDTNIYGNFTVKPLYQSYSNIGTASGNVIVPAYFTNSGNTGLNNLSIDGTLKSLGPAHLKDAVLSQGFYTNWNDSGNFGEMSFINSKGYGIGGYKYFNVSFDASNSSVLLMDIDGGGNVGVTGNVVCGGKTEGIYLRATQGVNGAITQGFKNLALPYGSYMSWNSSIYDGECDFIVSKAAGTGGFRFYNVTTDTANTSVLLMNIDGGGNVGIGTTTPSERLDVNGNVKCTYLKTSSDYRLNHNIQPLNGDYDITSLRPVSYKMMGQKATGFIAHELQEIFPYLVTGKKDGKIMQSIDYIGMIAILTHNPSKFKERSG